MSQRLGYDKDEMIAKTTDFASATDPTSGAALVSFTAVEGGQALAVAWVWDASAAGLFHLRVNETDRYSFAAGAAGGADNTEIIGRISYQAGDVISVVAADDLTGTFSGAIIYADA